MESISKRIRRKFWVLYHLGKAGFNEEELAKVYRTCLLPIFDYCAVVYHPMLTDNQDQLLERLQRQALKVIFGTGHTYTEMRRKADITTLRQRRIDLSDKFASKCLKSERFCHWFRENQGGRRSSREPGEKYEEEFARCLRYFNSPLFFMRRRLNWKPGLPYWERHRERRSRK